MSRKIRTSITPSSITVSVNLKLLRSLRETQQRGVSDIAYYLGYKTPTSYWLQERGSRGISIEVLYKLARLYNLDLIDLLIIEGDSSPIR